MANLPADLPTNWTQGQIISPNGTEVGLSEQYGYNYLNEQVNNTQTEVNSLSTAQTNTQQQVNTLNTQVGNIQGQVTTQGQSITALQETTTSQGQSISTLQSDVSAINTALDSVAQESSVQDIINSIGATADTGGSSTAGTLMAKMNDMLSNAGAVKSVQRGTCTMSSNESTKTVTISSVNLYKAVLILTGYAPSEYNANSRWAYGRIARSNSLSFKQTQGSAVTSSISIPWQVIEFY